MIQRQLLGFPAGRTTSTEYRKYELLVSARNPDSNASESFPIDSVRAASSGSGSLILFWFLSSLPERY